MYNFFTCLPLQALNDSITKNKRYEILLIYQEPLWTGKSFFSRFPMPSSTKKIEVTLHFRSHDSEMDIKDTKISSGQGTDTDSSAGLHLLNKSLKRWRNTRRRVWIGDVCMASFGGVVESQRLPPGTSLTVGQGFWEMAEISFASVMSMFLCHGSISI